MKNCMLLLLVALCLCTCNEQLHRTQSKKKAPKNIILLIGDGMGLTQLSTTYYYQDTPPSFSRFQTIGLHKNEPIGSKVTDSASGATAFASGVKTYNKAIGVDADTLPVSTILEWAAQQGRRTGLVATSSITHATPASFYAHVKSRYLAEDIAKELTVSPVNFFAGGGYKWFAEREDGANYLDTMLYNGWKVDTVSLPVVVPDADHVGYLLAPDGMPKMQEGRGDFLLNATSLALDYLKKDSDGFFLMVEGSQIDWGGHDNDSDYLVEEVKDFDKAIHAALDFAERDGNTLVIVTADHETGGYSLSAPTIFGKTDYGIIQPSFSTGNHSATLIPVFAYGPGEYLFRGVYGNNDIYHKMMAAWGSK